MMKPTSRICCILLAALTLLAATASTAAAETSIYDWSDEEAPILIDTDSGLLLLGQDGQPLRVFSWEPSSGDNNRPVRLLDMNDDGSLQIVGSGAPTFVTDSAGVPEFSFEDGCDQIAIADVYKDSERDLFCVQGTEVGLYSHNGSRVWSADLGRYLDFCVAGDMTGDTRPDIECKYRGRNQFVRFKSNGEVLDSAASEQNVQTPENPDDEIEPVDEAVWTGQETFDLDGDGTAGETLQVDGSTLQIHGEGQEEPLATVDADGTIEAAAVTEFGKKEGNHVVAATADTIYVIGNAGSDVAEFSADPDDYDRVPSAEFDGLHANGFGEADSDVKDLVRQVQDEIAECYGSRLRSAPFAGTGRYIMQLHVGEDGSIQNLNERHSGVDDDTIESCAQDAVRGVDFPGAEDGRAIVNVNVLFSFVDEEN